jgi:ribosomal protein S27E
MKGGVFVYCPACHHRQSIGSRAESLHLPVHVTCEGCGALLTLDKSESGGVHVTAQGAQAG